MSTLSPEHLLAQYRWRYAVKRFQTGKEIPGELWEALEDALVLSPSSYGIQPWKFIVVRDPDLKRRLRAVSYGQPQIEECSHLVVFAVRKGLSAADIQAYIDRIVAVRGVSPESLAGFRDMMLGTLANMPNREALDAWSARQVYLALGFFLASAAALGVDACPMEGLDPDQYDEILGLAERGYGTLCVATAGYRSPEDAYGQQAKVRFDKEEVLERR